MCQVFEVSRSGYYEWLTRPESAHREADRHLGERVKRAFEKGRGSDGTRRIQQE